MPSVAPVLAQAPALRVCGDPENLPFSNERLEGFENRIAAVVAAELGATPVYAWWPHQRGLVRNTIDAGTCDVIFGVPEGLDFVLWTKPYYRSSYVMAYRGDRGYDFRSLDAPELQQLRIGVHVNTPPEESLARRGLLDNISTYSLFFDPRGDRDRPRKLLDDLVAGTVDVAVAWGPLAGWAARTSDAPLELVPLEDEPGVPLSFDISMGVAKGNEELKGRLEAAIDRRRAEIVAILEEYGVPVVPIGASGAADPNADAAPPASAPVDPAPAPRRLNPFTGNADMAAEGRTLYFQVGCQGCHGGGWRRRDGHLRDRRRLGVRQRRRGAVPAHQGRDARADDADRLQRARGRRSLADPGVHPVGLRRRSRPYRLVGGARGCRRVVLGEICTAAAPRPQGPFAVCRSM